LTVFSPNLHGHRIAGARQCPVFFRLELSCRNHRPRPINPWLYLGIPFVTIVALILLEWTSVDMDLANLFFDRAAGEFIGRHSYVLETILHDRVKQVVIA
jgi:membrane-associated PAP2 superfamily phosphatase